jgi:RNAse (barnase) inhibitor barstar
MQVYDWIGVSINNKKELEKFRKYKEEFKFKNFTIITNFNLQNLYDFDLIEKFVKEQDCLWTIQFTVYKEASPLALYSNENEEAFNFLKEKYTKSTARIILSDNIRTDIGCGAGLSSIGITFNGIVIPCLSMRSWTKYDVVDAKVIYNITETSLKEIWENGFKKQRFGCFECCKDACQNKFLEPKELNPLEIIQIPFKSPFEKNHDWKKFLEEIHEKSKENPNLPHTFPEIEPGHVVMYGVASPGRVLVYGVSMPTDNVYLYGVITDSTNIQEYKHENPDSLNKIIKKADKSDNANDEK